MRRTGREWTREELIVVCALYHSIPFGRMHHRNPGVMETARLLGRSPGSVAMKLVNFASLDPAQRGRGIRGLQGASRLDSEIWHAFISSFEAYGAESERILQGLNRDGTGIEMPGTPLEGEPLYAGPSEGTVPEARIRLAQGFFRKMILAAYGGACCVSGLPVEDLLVASHILPWSLFPEHRVNPRNGLCLAAHLDRAFDRGLITVDEKFRVRTSPRLRDYPENPTLRSEFLDRQGQPVRIPERYPPDPEFLDYHRKHIFVAG